MNAVDFFLAHQVFGTVTMYILRVVEKPFKNLQFGWTESTKLITQSEKGQNRIS